MPPRASFRFYHPLTADAAYRAMLHKNRLVLHNAAAEALAARHVPGAADEVQLLTALAGQYEQARRWVEAHRCLCQALRQRASSGLHAGWDEAVQRAGRLWAAARRIDPRLPEGSALLCNAASFRHSALGQPDAAVAQAQRALELAKLGGDALQAAEALTNLGIAEQTRGRLDDALAHYRACLSAHRALGNGDGVMYALNNTGLVLLDLGAPEESRACLEEGLAMARTAGNERMQALLELNLGVNCVQREQFAAGLPRFETALALCRRIGMRRVEGIALGDLGELRYRLNERAAGEALLEAALSIARETTAPRYSALWLSLLAAIAADQGRAELSRARCTEARNHAAQVGDPYVLGLVLQRAAQAELRLGDPPAARRLLEGAEDAAAQAGSRPDSVLRRELAELRARLEQTETA